MFSKIVLYFLFDAVLWVSVTAEKCTDPNSHWSEEDATICQNTCERPDLSLYCRHAGPVAGCVCNTGYLKSRDGVCLLAEKCAVKEKEVCGINEIMVSCLNPCPPEDCRTIGIRFNCQTPDPSECKPGCRCAFNYRRNDRGMCIPIENCPPLNCIGANEVYDPCPPICPGEDCSQAPLNGICPYRIGIRLQCFPACRCQNGFFRKMVANENICVSREECSEP